MSITLENLKSYIDQCIDAKITAMLQGGGLTLNDGKMTMTPHGSSWIEGRYNATIKLPRPENSLYYPALSMKTPNGSWEIGTYNTERLWFSYAPDSRYSSSINKVVQCYFDPDESTNKVTLK